MFNDVEKRYYNDPLFHDLVEMLVSHMEGCNTTPTEMREAAMFAQMLFENRHPRPWVMKQDGTLERRSV